MHTNTYAHTHTKKKISIHRINLCQVSGSGADRKKTDIGVRAKKKTGKFALFMCISRILGRSNKSIDKRTAAEKKP